MFPDAILLDASIMNLVVLRGVATNDFIQPHLNGFPPKILKHLSSFCG